jgi:hypothetical protein
MTSKAFKESARFLAIVFLTVLTSVACVELIVLTI